MKIISTKVSKIWVIAMSFCFNYAVNAQSTEDESIEFSGSVETYFRTNLSGVAYEAGNSVIDATLTTSYTSKDLRLSQNLD